MTAARLLALIMMGTGASLYMYWMYPKRSLRTYRRHLHKRPHFAERIPPLVEREAKRRTLGIVGFALMTLGILIILVLPDVNVSS